MAGPLRRRRVRQAQLRCRIGRDQAVAGIFGRRPAHHLGRHDYNVNAAAAAEWFAKVAAPSKALVWFEDSAHEMFNEEPGKTLVSLVRYERPFAEKAGDVAP